MPSPGVGAFTPAGVGAAYTPAPGVGVPLTAPVFGESSPPVGAYVQSLPAVASPPPGGPLLRDADRIVLPTLTPTSGFEVWRFDAASAVVAASARPAQAAVWIEDIRKLNVHQLAACDPTFATLDARLFQGLVASLQGPSMTLAEQDVLLLARSACRIGAVRQLWTLVDGEYDRDKQGRQQRAYKLIATYRQCTAQTQVEAALLQLETLLAELRGTPQEPTPEFFATVVKSTFGGVPELGALFAAAELHGLLSPGTAQPSKVLAAIRKSILDERDRISLAKEFVPPRGPKKKGSSADDKLDGIAAPGKGKGKDKDKGSKDKGKGGKGKSGKGGKPQAGNEHDGHPHQQNQTARSRRRRCACHFVHVVFSSRPWSRRLLVQPYVAAIQRTELYRYVVDRK